MQGKYRYLAILLSLADFFDEKEGTTILERVAFLLRLSILALILHNYNITSRFGLFSFRAEHMIPLITIG